MPSSWSASLRFELQFTGENINLWGDKLNTVLSHADFAVAGVVTKTLVGDYTLTANNAADDEARASALVFNGVAATVTIPAVPKAYDVTNNTSGIVTITTGSGRTAQVRAGEFARVRSDGANVDRIQPFYFSNMRLQGVMDPTGPQDAATKAYVDATAFDMAGGGLPGQTGNAGNFLTTDGTNAAWIAITAASIGAVGSVAPSITGGLTLTGGFVQSGSSKFTPAAVAALAVDFSNSDVQTKSISSNSAFTWTGFTAGKAQSVTLVLTITSAAVPSWPVGTTYPGGVDPGSTLGNGTHELQLTTYNGAAPVTVSVAKRAIA
jgi:hypothetical protein